MLLNTSFEFVSSPNRLSPITCASISWPMDTGTTHYRANMWANKGHITKLFPWLCIGCFALTLLTHSLYYPFPVFVMFCRMWLNCFWRSRLSYFSRLMSLKKMSSFMKSSGPEIWSLSAFTAYCFATRASISCYKVFFVRHFS